jgi:hypothetical protein
MRFAQPTIFNNTLTMPALSWHEPVHLLASTCLVVGAVQPPASRMNGALTLTLDPQLILDVTVLVVAAAVCGVVAEVLQVGGQRMVPAASVWWMLVHQTLLT